MIGFVIDGLLLLYLVWFLYLAIMNLARVRNESERTWEILFVTVRIGELTKPAYVLGMPIFVVGLALDILGNLIPMSFILWEPPKWGEWTITKRLQRHADESTDYRRTVAIWMGVHLLNKFDPKGWHIRFILQS